MLKLQLCKVKTMPRSPFKTENPWKGYSGVISRACPTFLCHAWGRRSVGAVAAETKQDQAANSVHSPLRSPAEQWLQMPSPSVWTQGWHIPIRVLLKVHPLLLISPAKTQELQSTSNKQPTSCRSRWCPCRGAQSCIHTKQKFGNGIQLAYCLINLKLTSLAPPAAVLKVAGTPIQDGSSTSEEP